MKSKIFLIFTIAVTIFASCKDNEMIKDNEITDDESLSFSLNRRGGGQD
jgi:hypothetical protein